eukprot:SAG25_NODE_556_length_6947_cov_7.702242_1_plen_92_part_00
MMARHISKQAADRPVRLVMVNSAEAAAQEIEQLPPDEVPDQSRLLGTALKNENQAAETALRFLWTQLTADDAPAELHIVLRCDRTWQLRHK